MYTEKLVGLEKAYKKRKLMSQVSNKTFNQKTLYAERIMKGLCTACGSKKTDKEHVNCKKCRDHRNKQEKRRKEKKIADLLRGI